MPVDSVTIDAIQSRCNRTEDATDAKSEAVKMSPSETFQRTMIESCSQAVSLSINEDVSPLGREDEDSINQHHLIIYYTSTSLIYPIFSTLTLYFNTTSLSFKMQQALFIISALGLPLLASAGVISNKANIIVKRDNPLTVQTFKTNGKPTGTAANVDNAVDGSVGTVVLDCGTITATVVQAKPVTCNFMLPATMPSGTFTGTPGAGFYSISVPGSCAGIVEEVGVFIEATGAGDIGESPNLDRCVGGTNGHDDINLCVSGTTLVDC